MISSDKEHIYYIAKTAAEKGIKHIIFSPGSRSAPLVIAFNRQPGITCYVLPDERSAAFTAMGMAQQSHETVGLVCTSGSAVLNYAPAISEAYYQKIPLLIMTADRPNEAIDQGENQSIYQFDIYKNYIKKSFELPVDTQDERDQWYSLRQFNEAINIASAHPKGPVHVNIPLREPLYQTKEYNPSQTPFQNIKTYSVLSEISPEDYQNLGSSWSSFAKKIIILGSMRPDPSLRMVLEQLASREDVVVFSENTSNQLSASFVQNIDALVEYIDTKKKSDFTPELVITAGGGLISKKLKFWLRKASIQEHWHISESNEHWDNFHALKKIVPLKPHGFFSFIQSHTLENKSSYKKNFDALKQKIALVHQAYIDHLPFTDFKVFQLLLNELPESSTLFFGNSTPIRYSNLIPLSKNKPFEVYANRGVSGIDGVLSTSIGGSMIRPDRKHLCFIGDISFFYDSNAWWNQYIGPNFKCILFNNQGGNIFKIIPGPDQLPEVETFFETSHQLNSKPIAELYNLQYYRVGQMESLLTVWKQFLNDDSGKPCLLEINTPSESSNYLRQYFATIRNLDA